MPLGYDFLKGFSPFDAFLGTRKKVKNCKRGGGELGEQGTQTHWQKKKKMNGSWAIQKQQLFWGPRSWAITVAIGLLFHNKTFMSDTGKAGQQMFQNAT